MVMMLTQALPPITRAAIRHTPHSMGMDRQTLGPCSACWRTVDERQECTWDAARRTWRHVRCTDAGRS